MEADDCRSCCNSSTHINFHSGIMAALPGYQQLDVAPVLEGSTQQLVQLVIEAIKSGKKKVGAHIRQLRVQSEPRQSARPPRLPPTLLLAFGSAPRRSSWRSKSRWACNLLGPLSCKDCVAPLVLARAGPWQPVRKLPGQITTCPQPASTRPVVTASLHDPSIQAPSLGYASIGSSMSDCASSERCTAAAICLHHCGTAPPNVGMAVTHGMRRLR